MRTDTLPLRAFNGIENKVSTHVAGEQTTRQFAGILRNDIFG